MMVTGLHEGSRVVTAGVKLHEYLHVVSREVLLRNLPKLDVAGSNPVGRSIKPACERVARLDFHDAGAMNTEARCPGGLGYYQEIHGRVRRAQQPEST